MNEKHILKITTELNLAPRQVIATAVLLDDGATVPFIARYRKEKTGELDEVQITAIRDRLEQLQELDTRRESIISSLKERNLLTAELQAKIDAAETDVDAGGHLPAVPSEETDTRHDREGKGPRSARRVVVRARPRDRSAGGRKGIRRTRVSGRKSKITKSKLPKKRLPARATSSPNRSPTMPAPGRTLRELYLTKGVLKSKVLFGKEEEGAKFKDYFDWSEPADKAPSHRILAIRRGEKEGFLTSRLTPPEEDAQSVLERLFVKGKTPGGARSQSRRARRLQAAARFPDGRRGASVFQKESRRGSDPRVRRKPARTPARVAARTEKRRSRSIPVFAPAAKSSASTARENCSSTK